MIKRLLAAAAPAALALAVIAPAAHAADGAAQGRGFTARDMVNLDRVSDPRVSPDGRYVLYDLRTTDYAANKAAHAIWLVDLAAKGAQPRRLAASDGGASSARWSADGKAIYFVSSRGGSDQVWKTDLAGAKAEQATKLPADVGAFKLSPDGKSLVVAMAVHPDTESAAAPAKAADQAKATGVLYDKLFVRHWDAWADGTRNHLFSLALDGQGLALGKATPLMAGFDGDAPSKPYGDDAEFGFSNDGKAVWFAARLAGRTEPWSTNFDIYGAPVDGSKAPRNLTAKNPAWDTGLVMSPDGKTVAYRAMKRPGFEADRFHIILRDEATDAERELAAGWDRSADDLKWSPDGKSLYVVAGDVGQTRLFSIDVKSGKVTPLTGEGHVSAFDVSPKGLVYVSDNLTAPAQLFTLPLAGGKPVQVTNVNADKLAGVAMGAPEQFSFPGWNGETVHGYVVKPADYVAGKKYPVAFLIHGGPQGSFGNLFHYRWNAQTYAGAGYAVVMIDFHGSTGYGQAFTDAISTHWGDRPLEDLQKGWAFALSKYDFLDGDRACALGGSYGGFMVNWIAGNWNGPWKCLVNHDGVFDNRMMGYSTEELWFSEWENGGAAFANPQGYERFNPVNHVADWTKPMLVIHGQKDFRIPVEQGLGAFTALQRKGVPSELLYFADENHWVLKPQNSVQWHDSVLGWLNKWTAKPGA
ncbi:peptidase S9 [Caulobacter sp. CCUG 60055]|nr:S9 family peptidase [Caulobacter sp. CCUG 60055]MBQ1543924.1 S9 family peptidase [Caulobacteraceae bacterium]MCI3180615.1 peptidase S9 [Caulobacter sp. CCUG 60055]